VIDLDFDGLMNVSEVGGVRAQEGVGASKQGARLSQRPPPERPCGRARRPALLAHHASAPAPPRRPQVKSLVSQINFSYGLATKGARQAHMHLLGAGGYIKQQLTAQLPHLESWAVTVADEPYTEHFKVRPGKALEGEVG
jgi:hypothetical protein